MPGAPFEEPLPSSAADAVEQRGADDVAGVKTRDFEGPSSHVHSVVSNSGLLDNPLNRLVEPALLAFHRVREERADAVAPRRVLREREALVGNREDIRVVVIEEDAVEGLASCVGGDEAERQPDG